MLLVNLGTPETPDPAAVRRYLAEFLSDPRVIEVPALLWWVILHGFILRFRPRRSAKAYRDIWDPAGSPLLLHTRAQAKGLQERLRSDAPGRCTWNRPCATEVRPSPRVWNGYGR